MRALDKDRRSAGRCGGVENFIAIPRPILAQSRQRRVARFDDVHAIGPHQDVHEKL